VLTLLFASLSASTDATPAVVGSYFVA